MGFYAIERVAPGRGSATSWLELGKAQACSAFREQRMSLEDVSTYELITLRLETGREISSKRCLFAATYGNLLVGLPGPRADRNHLELLPHNLRSVFGNWPVHIIEPERRVSSGVEHLPVVKSRRCSRRCRWGQASIGRVWSWYGTKTRCTRRSRRGTSGRSRQ